MNIRSLRIAAPLVLISLVVCTNPAHAQTPFYWDPGNTASSPGSGGNGSWDSTTADWWVSGSSDSAWSAGNVANFAGAAGTVTLNAAETADGLTFVTPGYTIGGTNTLTLGGASPAITVPSGNTTISALIAGTTAVTVSGAGPLVLKGANGFNGGLTIEPSSAVVITTGGYTTGGAGTGPVTFAGSGTFTLSNITALANTSVSGGASGVMNIYLSGGNTWLTNSLAGFAGIYNVYGTAVSAQLVVGSGSVTPNINSSATWNITPGAVIDFNGSQTDPAVVNLYGLPYTGAADGALRLDNSIQSGNVILQGNSSIGNGAAGSTSIISGVISDTGGNFGFTAMGGNGVELQGANTYHGATVISNGTLFLNGAGSIANSSGLSIANGAILDMQQVSSTPYVFGGGQSINTLGGTAEIDGAVDVSAGSPISLLVNSAGLPLQAYFGGMTMHENPVTVTITPGTGFGGGGGNPVVLINGLTGTSDVSTSPLTVIQPNAGYTAGNAPALSISGNNLLLTVNNPVISSYSPYTYSNLFMYVGGVAPTFSLEANGATAYQWYSNGVAISGANSSTFSYPTNTAFPAGLLTNYCVASSSAGAATNFWVLDVVSTNSYIQNGEVFTYPPYPLAVLQSTNAQGVHVPPVAYWRLDEANDGLNDGNLDRPVNDWLGGYMGAYTNVNLGMGGYSAALDPAETSAQFGVFSATGSDATIPVPQGSALDFATGAGTTVNFTVEAWVNGGHQNHADAAILSQGTFSANDSMVLAVNSGGSSSDREFRFYVGYGAGHSVVNASTTILPSGTWEHMVGVCDETDGKVLFYINGVQVASSAIGSTAGNGNGGTPPPILIGNETGASGSWDGLIDDVAVYNYALPPAEILAHYNAKGTPPTVTMITSTNVDYGAPFVIAPSVEGGTAPLTNTWVDSNANSVVSTSATLSVPSATTDKYILTVSNAFSPPASTNVVSVNAIQGAPSFAAPGFNIMPAAQTVYVGTPVTLSVLAYGTYPLSYQWYNGVGPIAGAHGTSYTVAAGQGINTYYCIVNNGVAPAATSLSATVVGVSKPSDLYGQTILSNAPIAYWRLDEQPDNTNGDYGTIAHDYVGGHNMTYNGVVLDPPGPTLADSNSGALFGIFTATNSFAGEINQTSDGIQPIDLASGSPEFTVEAWVQTTNAQADGAGILAKGYPTGSEQFVLTTVGGNFDFYYYDSAVEVMVNCQSAVPANDGLWHHLVGVSDVVGLASAAGAHFYIDGQDAADGYSQGGKGLADPGSTSIQDRVTIGARAASNTTNLTDQFEGNIAEVALYNYPFGTNEVAADYSAGTNSLQFIQSSTISITNVTAVPKTSLTLTWTSISGESYQVQVTPSLGKSTLWSNLGAPVVASGTSTSYTDTSTNVTAGSAAFYRVVGN